jgi:hypothetical protein
MEVEGIEAETDEIDADAGDLIAASTDDDELEEIEAGEDDEADDDSA